MEARSLGRHIAVLTCILIFVLSFAPAVFAGEDGTDTTGDGGGAVGGVGTGAGGSATDGSLLLVGALTAGGVLALTAAGTLVIRRRANR